MGFCFTCGLGVSVLNIECGHSKLTNPLSYTFKAFLKIGLIIGIVDIEK